MYIYLTYTCIHVCMDMCEYLYGCHRSMLGFFFYFSWCFFMCMCMMCVRRSIWMCACICTYVCAHAHMYTWVAWGCHGESSVIILYYISQRWVSLLNPGLPDVDEAAYIPLTLSKHCGSRPAHWLASLPGKWVLESSIQDSNSFVLYNFFIEK